VKRGEVWTVAGGTSYTGKPRPAVIVQEDRFDQTSSITLCAFTSDPTDAPLLRVLIEPTDRNGLTFSSRPMNSTARIRRD
jgi:mRNA interferase MazF